MVSTTIILSIILALLLTALLAFAWPVSIWATQQYANTWVGITADKARARVGRATIIEEQWAHGGYSGQCFVVTYKLYTLRLFFSDEQKVIHASIGIDGSMKTAGF